MISKNSALNSSINGNIFNRDASVEFERKSINI